MEKELVYQFISTQLAYQAFLVEQVTFIKGKGCIHTIVGNRAIDYIVRVLVAFLGAIAHYEVYPFLGRAIKAQLQLRFDSPTEEWVDFVMRNRTEKGYEHSYDIVYGPVANDRVYAAFALYESNLLDKEGLIRELRAYELVDQFLFHTEQSLQHLTFIEAKEVTL